MAVITTEHQVDVRRMQLDEILRINPPFRYEVLQEWLDDEYSDGPVLLRSNNGKPMKVGYNGSWTTIPPKGKKVDRKLAVVLLQDYGRDGKYYDVDQATGVSRGMWAQMAAKQREQYEGFELNFLDSYLTHIPNKISDGLGEDVDEDGEPQLPVIENPNAAQLDQTDE